MSVPIYVVDAFTSEAFRGNPAGVCLLDSPADEVWMQSVAAEMRHAETAFLVPVGPGEWGLRWFTPTVEVDLCGHATLASAHVFFTLGPAAEDASIRFHTRSGVLTAGRDGDRTILDFPSEKPEPCRIPAALDLPCRTTWTGKNRMDWFVALPSSNDVVSYQPDFEQIRALGMRGLILTAEGDNSVHDFVSRFFAPQSGVDEDPVTGSAHCALGPFWAERLGKTRLRGYQASARGGEVEVDASGPRVQLIGQAVTVLAGELHV